jgi:hypothetical protein
MDKGFQKIPKVFLSIREGNQFYFKENPESICESFMVSYLIDGTCVMSGDFGCLCWKRSCFPKQLDYGFPSKETSIGYFAEKVSQHNIPQQIHEIDVDTQRVHYGNYAWLFRFMFECLQSVSEDILKEVKADGTTTDGIPSSNKLLGILPTNYYEPKKRIKNVIKISGCQKISSGQYIKERSNIWGSR